MHKDNGVVPGQFEQKFLGGTMEGESPFEVEAGPFASTNSTNWLLLEAKAPIVISERIY